MRQDYRQAAALQRRFTLPPRLPGRRFLVALWAWM